MIPEILKKLENLISNNMRVIVICIEDIEILHSVDTEIHKRKLKDVVVWHCVNYGNDNSIENRLSINEINDIERMHNLYDFSDKIIVVSESNQYGNLFNYMKAGIFTKHEIVDALLYTI